MSWASAMILVALTVSLSPDNGLAEQRIVGENKWYNSHERLPEPLWNL